MNAIIARLIAVGDSRAIGDLKKFRGFVDDPASE
jgi:hypothetical protein